MSKNYISDIFFNILKIYTIKIGDAEINYRSIPEDHQDFS